MALVEQRPETAAPVGLRRPDASRFPFPVPNGWFAVARADEVERGAVLPVHYFGQDLVVFRTAGGEPHVLEAYCAHLGAHLGVGAGSPLSKEPGPGCVHGDTIVCPFHGWRYDGTGRCVEIPYGEGRIPDRARVRSFPTVERNGLVLAWHHLRDEPPAWDVPRLPELQGDPDWVPPIYTDRIIETALQELAENDHDTAHFVFVHGADRIPDTEFATAPDGRVKTTTAVIPAGRPMGGDDGVTLDHDVPFSRETHQLGYSMMRIPGVLTFLAASSPIEVDRTHQRWVFTYPRALGDAAGQAVVDAFAASGIYQDIPIWEHKRYVERPLLVKGDGPIAEYRRWVRQFYSA